MSGINTNNSVSPTRGDIEPKTQRSQQVEQSATEPAVDDTRVSSTASDGDAVSFTQAAEDLQRLEAQLRDIPGVDIKRVESIRQSIEDGSYGVDTERLMNSLIQSERDFS